MPDLAPHPHPPPHRSRSASTSSWHEFLRSRPGRRFQQAHARHQQAGQRSHGVLRWLLVGLGVLITLAGVVLLAFPGPGLLVALVGLGLIAREFLAVARLLDRGELWLRPLFTRLRRWGRRHIRMQSSFWLVCGLTAALGIAGIVVGWRVLR